MSTLLIVANVLGYIGFTMLYIQVVFGSRHIFKFFTKDTVKVNKIHSVLGKYVILAVLLHPLLAMAYRLEDLAWIITPNFNVPSEVAITFGRAALLLFMAVWITSAVVRAKIKWNPWKKIHLLAYPLVFLIFPHIKQIGTFYEKYSFIQFLWALLFILFIISILYRLLTWAGIGKQVYKLSEKSLVGTDIMLITLTPVGRKIYSDIGQHFFLQSKRFGSEHPYSVVYNKDGQITFGLRKSGKFWDEVMAKQIGQILFIDGPYGTFTEEAQNTSAKVIISGGIGVTPFVSLVDTFGQNTIYINCNRSVEDIIFRDMLMQKVTKYVDIVENLVPETAISTISGKITPEIIKEQVGSTQATLPYFVCGSPVFVKVVRQMLLENGVSKKQIYYEELGF